MSSLEEGETEEEGEEQKGGLYETCGRRCRYIPPMTLEGDGLFLILPPAGSAT
jgi:hypothetical protein